MRLAASFVAAIFLGGVGMFLYVYFMSFKDSDDLFPVIIAYVLLASRTDRKDDFRVLAH
jgi:hypothetical protein